MCRHLAYLGPPVFLSTLLMDPPYSLYRQSWAPRQQRHGTVNADGFGIGWYPPAGSAHPADPADAAPFRYRRAVPLWADANMPELAHAVRSGAVLAAVRDATSGTSQEEGAAAPFRTGRWLFSHNGAVLDWERLPADAELGLPASALSGLEARCDSALLWAAVSARLSEGQPPGDALADVVLRTAAVRPGARLNFLLTDGHRIAASCWGDTLWYRADSDGLRVAAEPDGEADLPAGGGPPDGGTHQQVSDTSGGWRQVPDRTLLLATADRVRTRPLTPDTGGPGHAPSAPPASAARHAVAVDERNSTT